MKKIRKNFPKSRFMVKEYENPYDEPRYEDEFYNYERYDESDLLNTAIDTFNEFLEYAVPMYYSKFLYSKFSWEREIEDYFTGIYYNDDETDLFLPERSGFKMGRDKVIFFIDDGDVVIQEDTPSVMGNYDLFHELRTHYKHYYKGFYPMIMDLIKNLEFYEKKYKMNVSNKYKVEISSSKLLSAFGLENSVKDQNKIFETILTEFPEIFHKFPDLVFYKKNKGIVKKVASATNKNLDELLSICVFWECCINRIFEEDFLTKKYEIFTFTRGLDDIKKDYEEWISIVIEDFLNERVSIWYY